jgi:hypothetical protein
MVKPRPAAPLVVTKPGFLLNLLIALGLPTHFGDIDQATK